MFENSSQIKQFLKKHNILPKKSLGQNFLMDNDVLDKIVSSAELSKENDRVVEVGAGPGILSRKLADISQELVSIEIDQRMMEPWRDAMEEYSNAELVNLDILDYVPENQPYKVVANIPYYITSPILKHFLRHQEIRRPEMIVMLMQREVAERICDKRKPTLISWEIRVFADPEIVCNVPAASFFPAPKVESAVLKMNLLESPLVPEIDIDVFFKLLEYSFQQPRKTLFNNLSVVKDKLEVKSLLKKAEIVENTRAHQLNIDNWLKLFTFWKDS